MIKFEKLFFKNKKLLKSELLDVQKLDDAAENEPIHISDFDRSAVVYIEVHLGDVGQLLLHVLLELLQDAEDLPGGRRVARVRRQEGRQRLPVVPPEGKNYEIS